MNLADVTSQFPDEKSCIAFLESQRWPDGVECVKCQSRRISHVTSKGKTDKVRYLYHCMDCRNQFTVKAGTMFHDSHIPLNKWFMAIAIICQAKKGISANQVGRTIGVTTKSAWYLCHRIREAMNTGDFPLLKGTVEVDETYVGGKQKRNEHKETWYERKHPVVGIVERGGEVRFRKVPRANAKSVKAVFDECVSPNVHRIVTDESMIYPSVFDKQQELKRFTIKHAERYVDGWIHTNTVESSFSNFKRALVGSFHQMSYKHLDKYLREFEFRQNNKRNPAMFEQVLQNAAVTKHVTFRALVDGAEERF
jgi:transposase-like protein